MTNHDDPAVKFDYKKWNLVTIKDIKQGEELTLTYTFYNI
jgi:SET domain-containing protein